MIDPMASRERPIDRANRASAELVLLCARELRQARTAAGLSQREVAAAAGVDHSTVSRIERGVSPEVSVLVMVRLATVVGLEMSLRFYPGGDPIRDAAHLALLHRLRARIHPDLRWRTEVPLPIPGDRRAWDAVIAGLGFVIGIEAETRIRDGQAVVRKTNLKQRDGELDRVILLVADTRANRLALQLAREDLARWLPVSQRDALRALREGRDPGGNALVVL
jgi:transcriptional regulator with XRE-family HTH domain